MILIGKIIDGKVPYNPTITIEKEIYKDLYGHGYIEISKDMLN